MYLSDLAVTDFRSYTSAALTLTPGVSTLVGRNGHGKTNLLEAIGYLGTLASHRVSSDAALVRAGAERAYLSGRVHHGGTSTVVEVEINPGKANRARLNRGAVPRAREVLGRVRTVLFAPEDLALTKGDPEGRRRYLDELNATRQPRLAAVRADYDRVLKQRNALLKSAASARRAGRTFQLDTLEIWDAKLAELGGELMAARVDLLRALREPIRAAYAHLSDQASEAQVGYLASAAPADLAEGADEESMWADPQSARQALAAALVRERANELERGTSLAGPHRDDVDLRLGDLPAKGYASHGESWSLALALRLGAFAVLREAYSWEPEGDPILVLDDVFAELDARRRERLAQLVVDAPQVLISAAVVEDLPTELVGRRFEVKRAEDGQSEVVADE